MFGFDLAHVVFDAASVAWIYPYIVVCILHGMIHFKPFFEQFFQHCVTFSAFLPPVISTAAGVGFIVKWPIFHNFPAVMLVGLVYNHGLEQNHE